MRGFSPSVSDIDVLVVVEDDPPLHAATLRHLGDRLVALPAPGRGLHLSIVTAARAHAPSAPWPFLLHVATAPADTKVIVGIGHHGDPDLVMHYTVVRAAGITVTGQAPVATPVDRDAVVRYLADELAWAETHAGEAYGVLTAARALCYLRDGSIVSKIDGAERELARGGPTELLHRALKVQQGRTVERPPNEAAISFMRSAQAEHRAEADE